MKPSYLKLLNWKLFIKPDTITNTDKTDIRK